MRIKDEAELDRALSKPSARLVELMGRLDGDLMILGVAGKMGVTLGAMAVDAARAAGAMKKIYGVSRFSDPEARRKLEERGVATIPCDLLDQKALADLPEARNIVYMAGRKFGTDGSEELTWAMNTLVPGYVATRFKASRIVAFSTGCVYPLVPAASGGCDESVAPAPVGEYAQSCLGRERVFGHFAKTNATATLLLRLNYAVDLRYGVLHDIGRKVWEGAPVSRSVGHFNALWQGDANNYALLALGQCASPASVLNITGPETIAVDHVAGRFAQLMGKPVSHEGVRGDAAYLNNAGKAFRLFGYPEVSLDQMIEWQARWIMDGGEDLGKPTHFEVNDGKF